MLGIQGTQVFQTQSHDNFNLTKKPGKLTSSESLGPQGVGFSLYPPREKHLHPFLSRSGDMKGQLRVRVPCPGTPSSGPPLSTALPSSLPCSVSPSLLDLEDTDSAKRTMSEDIQRNPSFLTVGDAAEEPLLEAEK